MKIVGLITRPLNGVDFHRIQLPLSSYPYQHGDSMMLVGNDKALHGQILEDATIVMWCRKCPFDLNAILTLRNKYGFKIIVDIDDYWILPINHILYDDWRIKCVSEDIIKCMRIADLVTTTHEYLREKILRYNENVEIIPNALPYGQGQFNQLKEDDTNNILYSCSITHYHDIRSISQFLLMCKSDSEIQKFSLCLAGINNSNQTMSDIWDKLRIEAEKFGNIKLWSWLPVESYMNHYSYCDISIAPLESNEFNRCKSFLKGLEAGAKDIPLLASGIHPYTELPVIHCKTQKDWINNLRELVKRPELRQEKGKILGNYVRNEYNLKKINGLRSKIYDKWRVNRSPSENKQSALQSLKDSGGVFGT